MAGDSIAQLIVEVGANLASLYKGMQEAADVVGRAGATISGKLEGIGGSLDALGGKFTKLVELFGIGLSFHFVKELVAGSIEAQASLEDLALRVGTTAETLSALTPAARLSGTSMEDVANISAKFSKSLVELQNGTGKSVSAFHALGFSSADAARLLKDPAAGLVEVAKRMSQFADDGNKAAAAQLAFGKSGAASLPFFHDLAEVGADVILVTNQQAAAAKALQDQWVQMSITTEKLKNDLVAELVPTLSVLLKVWKDLGDAPGGFKDAIRDLIATGQVKAWAQEAAVWLAKLADLITDGPRVLRPYAESLGFVAISIIDLGKAIAGALIGFTNPLLGFQIMKEAFNEVQTNFKNLKQSFVEGQGALSTKYYDAVTGAFINMALAAGDTEAAVEKKAKPALQGLGKEASDSAGKLQAAANAYDKALAELAKAQIAAGAALGEAQIKNELDGVQRALDQNLISFNQFYARRAALQRDALAEETNKLRLQIAEQQKLVDNLGTQVATIKPEGNGLKQQTQYALAYLKTAKDLADAQKVLTDLQGQLDVKQEEGVKIGSDYIESLAKQSDGILKSNLELEKSIAAQDRQNEQIGLTGSQIALLNVTRIQELKDANELVGLVPGVAEYYDAQIAGAKRLADSVAKGEGISRVVDAFHELDSAAQNVFENIFEKGNHVFQDLGKSIKKFVLDLIYQLTIKPIIVNLVQSVTGVGGLGGAGPGGLLGLFTQGGGSFGGLGNAVGGAGGLSGLFSGFATSGAGVALGLGETVGSSAAAAAAGGLSLGVEAGATAATGIMTTAGAAIAAAIPVVGWAVAAAAAIYSIIQSNKKPTPVEGQFGFRGINVPGSEFEDNAFTASKFGNIGFLDQGTQQFSGEAGQALNKSVAGLLDLFAKRFTDAQIAQTATNLQALQFPHFSGTFTTEDFLAKYGDQILKQVATTAFDVLDPALGKVIAGFAGTGKELTTFIGSLLVFDDVTKKLPADVRTSLTEAIGNTQDGLDKVVTFATAFLNLQDILNANPLDDIAKAQKAQTTSGAFDLAGSALSDLIDKFDGSADAATRLTAATAGYYQAQVALISQIEQVKQSISNMFGDTIRNLQLQVLDNEGQQAFLSDEIARFQQQLITATDPAVIADLANKLNADIGQLFSLQTAQFQQAAQDQTNLTPEQQAEYVRQQQQALLATFVPEIQQVNDTATQRLTDLGLAAQDQFNTLATDVRDVLTKAIDHMAETQQAAADSQQAAADTMQGAADTIANAPPIQVIVVTPQNTSEQTG